MLNVSVIIPAYNEAENIDTLLEKLFYDSVKEPNEVLVVDANSNDGTGQIVKNWANIKKENRIKLIQLKAQAYPGKGRNIGVKHSKSEYVAFIDCALHPETDWLEKLVKPFETDSELEIVWGKSYPLAVSGWERAFAALVEPKKNTKKRVIRSSCIRKDSFNKIGGFREDLRSSEDRIFIKQVIELKLKEFFCEANAWYSGYPKSYMAAFKKWLVYSENSVYGSLHLKRLLLTILEFLGIICVGALGILAFGWKGLFVAILFFFIFRTVAGLCNSDIKLKSFKELVYAISISFFIDIGRICGLIKGILKKNFKKR